MKKSVTSAILNFICFLASALAVGYLMFGLNAQFMENGSTACLKYFTVLSNIFGGTVSLVFFILNIIKFQKKDFLFPRWAVILKTMSTIALTLTMLTVLAFLGPQIGYVPLLSNEQLFLHLLCPLTSMITMLFFDTDKIISLKNSFYGILPMFIYGIVYAYMVLIVGKENGGWDDFYGFNIGGFWYISFMAVLLITFGLSIGEIYIANQILLISKTPKKYRKPPALLWYGAAYTWGLWFRIKYNVHIDRSGLKDLKHQKGALILAQHTSNFDHIIIGSALLPARPTFVLSKHFPAQSKKMRWILTVIHSISKKMFCPDTRAVIDMLRSVEAGNTLVLFPEGRLTWYSESLRITDGTASLVKKLGVNVYAIHVDGAGKSFPKWAQCFRRGRINITTEKMFDKTDIPNYTTDYIDSAIRTAFNHNEENVLTDIAFKTSDTTLGLDGIIWKCPKCKSEDTLVTEKCSIKCLNCDLNASIDFYGKISGLPEEYNIFTVADWYNFCKRSFDITMPFETECIIATENKDGYLVQNAGKGIFRINRDSMSLVGKYDVGDGETEINCTTAPEKVKGIPISVSAHFDMYWNDKLFHLTTSPDKRKAIIPVTYMDLLMEEKLK